jgi:hypothetical protein
VERQLDIIRAAPLHLLVPAGLLALLVLAFLAFFLLPGAIHWVRLGRLRRGVDRLEGRTPPQAFRQLFGRDRKLAHLWKQYQDSLHLQRGEPADRDGASPQAVTVRATLPAETFFNTQSMVDGRLRTEFFKHLPGIFTGIGIIGTFAGLIEGLRQFQVSENAATVRASLESLMHSVGEAFLVSASAIAAAMVVTFIEKLLLASLYAQAEDIAHAIDARFDGGAGEDYLQRLVKASEDSALQSRTLKDALIAELGGVLREVAAEERAAVARRDDRLVERLEAATTAQSAALGAAVGEAVRDAMARVFESGLKAPLDNLAAAMVPAARAQSDAGTALRDTLEAFANRLATLLEKQSVGAGDVGRQTAREMQDAMQGLQSLVNGLTEQMRTSQVESGERVQHGLADIGRQVSDMLRAANEAQQRMLGSAQARDEAVLERTTQAAESLSGEMSGAAREAAAQMAAAAAQMARSVETLSLATGSALDRMGAGAEAMNGASQGFAAAAERAGEAMASARGAATGFGDIGSALVSGAGALQESLADYRSQRDTMAAMVNELQATVAAARHEAGLSADVLARIESATQRLGQAQQATEQYLAGVSHVLGDAHQAFAVGVRKTLELANTEFHARLSTSVGLLASTIAELESVLSQAVPPGTRPPP